MPGKQKLLLLLLIVTIDKILLFPAYCYGMEMTAKNIILKLNGSYKNLIAFSNTLNGKAFTHDINRVRLKTKGDIGDFFSFKVIYDNEFFLGDFLPTNEFKILNNTESLTYYDLKQGIIEEHEFFWQHSLYRGHVKFSVSNTSLTVGRQRIPWGNGIYFSPLDLFNPSSPFQIENGERIGVDAIYMEQLFLSNHSFSAVYQVADKYEDSKQGIRYRVLYNDIDITLIGGIFNDQIVSGGGGSLTVWNTVIRSEATYTIPKQEDDNEFFRFNINANYSITGDFDIWGEYFFNGKEGKGAKSKTIKIQNFKGDISTTNSHFLSLGSTYTYDTDLSFSVSTIFDLEGVSYYINPYLVYELFKNTDFSAGSRLYFGGDRTEFEQLPHLYYISLEWSF